MWVRLYYPEGGFGKGWQGRPASAEETPYEVDTSSGAIRSRGRLMSATTLPEGYLQIGLSFKGRRQTLRVHSLVCWVAHGPRPADKASVDHADRDRSHNDEKNLSWASHQEQAENRDTTTSGRKRGLLPFELEEGEEVYDFRGSPGNVYTGPKVQITSHNTVIRQGLVSQIKTMPGHYPKIALVKYPHAKKRNCYVHTLAWSAFHGPEAVVPKIINHRDHDITNFRPDNLEHSSASHNAIAAYDAGRHDHTRRARQRITVIDADDASFVREYASHTEAAIHLSAHRGPISKSARSTYRTFTGTVDGLKRKLRAVCVK